MLMCLITIIVLGCYKSYNNIDKSYLTFFNWFNVNSRRYSICFSMKIKAFIFNSLQHLVSVEGVVIIFGVMTCITFISINIIKYNYLTEIILNPVRIYNNYIIFKNKINKLCYQPNSDLLLFAYMFGYQYTAITSLEWFRNVCIWFHMVVIHTHTHCTHTCVHVDNPM